MLTNFKMHYSTNYRKMLNVTLYINKLQLKLPLELTLAKTLRKILNERTRGH